MTFKLDAPETLAYVSYLREQGYTYILPIDDKRYACLCPFGYTVAIITGHWFDRTGYDDRWCYHDYPTALGALIEWAKADFKDEPMGWHRHPKSGRRRPDGDWMQEYVNP